MTIGLGNKVTVTRGYRTPAGNVPLVDGDVVTIVEIVKAHPHPGPSTDSHVGGPFVRVRPIQNGWEGALWSASRFAEPTPEIVVLCGSTRFKDEFEVEQRRLGLEGKIVLTVSCFGHSGDLPPEACTDGHPTKTMLDDLHKRKIDLADRVLVVNPGGYIGTSTRSEIEYAELFDKPIDYLVAP